MNAEKIMEAVGYIDSDLVEKHLAMRASLRQKGAVPFLWRRRICAIACAAVLLFGGFAAYEIYMTGYDWEYTAVSEGETSADAALKRNLAAIYYVNPSGQIRRDRVRMSGGYHDRFVVWRHLNGIGSEVTAEVKYYDSGNLYDGSRLIGNMTGGYRVTVMTVSADIKEYGNYDKLMRSLEKTMAGGSGDFFLMIEE